MVGYAKREDTEKALKKHSDGNIWLHTGDYGCLNDNGEIIVLSRGLDRRYGGKNLYPLQMENKVIEIPGVYDGFFISVPDEEHEGYAVPYLYVILDEGAQLADVEAELKKRLEPHEYPAQINEIREREYFHFKTNKRLLVAEILNERKKAQ
jgi:long-chain acyl-CoA synthetase